MRDKRCTLELNFRVNFSKDSIICKHPNDTDCLIFLPFFYTPLQKNKNELKSIPLFQSSPYMLYFGCFCSHMIKNFPTAHKSPVDIRCFCSIQLVQLKLSHLVFCKFSLHETLLESLSFHFSTVKTTPSTMNFQQTSRGKAYFVCHNFFSERHHGVDGWSVKRFPSAILSGQECSWRSFETSCLLWPQPLVSLAWTGKQFLGIFCTASSGCTKKGENCHIQHYINRT